MKRISVFIGTRPECIKLAPVVWELRKSENIKLEVISSGQHKDLLKQMAADFELEFDHNFEIMRESQSLSTMSAKILEKATQYFENHECDIAIVQGDTTTAAMIGMAAFYNGVKVAHVEAGLRSNNINRPFPEEMNRKLISTFATYNFAPTEGAKLNLLNEGVREESIYVVGNTVVDAQKIVLEKLLKNSNLISDRVFQLVESIKKENKKIIFMTCHRRENLGQPIYQILQGVKLAMEKLTNYTLIYAVHPNPKVHKPVAEVLSGLGNVVLLDSQSYFSTLHLLKSADFVLTDSGGIQEEVIALSKPVVVLRDETERPEVIESGLGQLVSASKELVYEACIRVAQRTQISTSSKNPYGEGRSARLIVNLFET